MLEPAKRSIPLEKVKIKLFLKFHWATLEESSAIKYL